MGPAKPASRVLNGRKIRIDSPSTTIQYWIDTASKPSYLQESNIRNAVQQAVAQWQQIQGLPASLQFVERSDPPGTCRSTGWPYRCISGSHVGAPCTTTGAECDSEPSTQAWQCQQDCSQPPDDCIGESPLFNCADDVTVISWANSGDIIKQIDNGLLGAVFSPTGNRVQNWAWTVVGLSPDTSTMPNGDDVFLNNVSWTCLQPNDLVGVLLVVPIWTIAKWTTEQNGSVYLPSVLSHELGHVVGLNHSLDRHALMRGGDETWG